MAPALVPRALAPCTRRSAAWRGRPAILSRACALLTAWASAAGCSAALSYAEVAVEQCDDGHDDDLDGDVDCNDSDCLGRCIEEGPFRCANGLDDDGDGAVDALDPRCWPFARLDVERCATVDGGGWVVPPEPGIGWTGRGEYAIDPTGTSSSRVVGGIDEGARLRSVESFPGGWDGTVIEARVVLAGTVPGFVILAVGPLVVQVATLGPPRASSIATADGDRSATTDGAEIVPAGWSTVSIAVDRRAGQWRATLSIVPDATGEPSRASLELPPDWPAFDALSLEAQLYPTLDGGVAALGEVSVTRADHDPCGRRVPEVADHVLYAIARGPGRSCALGEGREGVLVSEDERSWRRAAGIAGGVGGTVPIWDDAAAVFRGLAPVLADDGTLAMAVGTSLDCERWDDTDVAFATAQPDAAPLPDPPGDEAPAFGYGYLLRRATPQAPYEHEIWVTTTQRGDDGAQARGLIRATSLDGAPGSFVVDRFVSLEETLGAPRRDPRVAEAWGTRVRITGVGADRVYLVASPLPRSIAMFVEQASDLLDVGAPILAPSGIAGTFDADTIVYGTLVMDPSPHAGVWNGELVYGRLEAGTARLAVRASTAR